MIIRDKNTFVSNCDWYAFSCRFQSEPNAHPFRCPLGGYRLDYYVGNKQFKYRAVLTAPDGNKVVTCLWWPHSSAIDHRLCLCEIGNSYLYDNRLQAAWLLLMSMAAMQFNNASRVDLCIDFEFKRPQSTIINGLRNKTFYVAQKSEGSKWWHGDEVEHQLNYGSNKSQFKWKIYNKSLELHAGGNRPPDKPYIVQEWADAGMDVANVWRCEVSITGCSVYEVLGGHITPSCIDNEAIKLGLFLECQDRRLAIRKREGHTRRSNDKRVYLIPIHADRAKMTERHNEERTRYAGVAEFNAIKRIVENSGLLMQQPELAGRLMDVALDVVYKYHASDHFEHVYGKSPYDMVCELMDNVGDGEFRHNYPTR